MIYDTLKCHIRLHIGMGAETSQNVFQIPKKRLVARASIKDVIAIDDWMTTVA